MEALAALAGNGWMSLATVLVIFGIICLMIKKGILSFKGHGLQVGESNERTLITNQWSYATTACEGQYNKIRPYCKSDEHAKYVIARVEDVFQEMVVHNHITDDDVYVRCKQQLVLMTIQKRCEDPHFSSPEFRQCCDKFVRDLIIDLYTMKKIMI